MRDHRKLEVFQLIDELVVSIYRHTRTFPQTEQFGLTSQMRRSAVSSAANIVEGAARSTEKDYNRFLNLSFSSLRELGYYLELAGRLGYLSDQCKDELLSSQGRAAAALASLIRVRRQA
ncbi:MAG: four helix bundle protein [Thermoanaerobaculia bacterium]